MAGLTTGLRTFVPQSPNGASPVIVESAPGVGVIVDGNPEAAALTMIDLPRARLVTQGDDRVAETHQVLLLPAAHPGGGATGVQRLEVVVDGWRFEVTLEPEWRAMLRDRATRTDGGPSKGGPAELRAIIPGRVVSIDVAAGDEVQAGQRMLVIEAMKMQNELRAPRAGTIRRLGVGAGQTVELGDLLLVIE